MTDVRSKDEDSHNHLPWLGCRVRLDLFHCARRMDGGLHTSPFYIRHTKLHRLSAYASCIAIHFLIRELESRHISPFDRGYCGFPFLGWCDTFPPP